MSRTPSVVSPSTKMTIAERVWYELSLCKLAFDAFGKSGHLLMLWNTETEIGFPAIRPCKIFVTPTEAAGTREAELDVDVLTITMGVLEQGAAKAIMRAVCSRDQYEKIHLLTQ